MFHFFNIQCKAFLNFFSNERGVTSIEYALIVSFIALAIIFSAGSLGSGLNNAFSNISTVLTVASGGSSSSGDGANNSNGNGGSNTGSTNNSNSNNSNNASNNNSNNNNNSNGNNNSNNNGKNNNNGNN